MNICEHCEHFQETVRGKSCSLATETYSNDGYGPFFQRANCIHDERLTVPKSKFKPIGESKVLRLEETIKFLEKLVEEKGKENTVLKERLVKI